MKENIPLVSVLVPCYNHEKYVEQTIESIINQTYKNIELIVIDDGSKDKSPEVVQALSEKYDFYFEKQQNIGLPATLNKMIKMAKGEYISLIASDDIKTLDKIEILMNEFKQLTDDYAVVFGNAKFIDDQGEEICLEINDQRYCNFLDYYTVAKNDFDYRKDFSTYKTILQRNYIPAMSTLIKKEALIKVGLYEENLSVEDWNMWLKLTKIYKMKYIDKIVAYYRFHDTNSMKIRIVQLLMDTIKILDREKSYCKTNNMTFIWKEYYYNTILILLRHKHYLLFIKKLILNNLTPFLINHIFKKILGFSK